MFSNIATKPDYINNDLNFNLDEDQFNLQIETKKTSVLYRSLVIPFAPLVVYQKILQISDGYDFLLESSDANTEKDRFSVIGLMPDKIWKVQDNKSFISVDLNTFQSESGQNVIENFRSFVDQAKINWSSVAVKYDKQILPAISAGVYGYFSYDFANTIHDIKFFHHQQDLTNIPDGIFIRPQILIVFDNQFKKTIICAPKYQDSNYSYQNLVDKIKKIETTMFDTLFLQQGAIDYHKKPEFEHNLTKQKYCKLVDIAKQYITMGDVFQVLPSQRIIADFPKYLKEIEFYQSLKETNPSPFLFYLHFPDFVLTGSSPEIMVALNDGKITIRPLAGTRKRGINEEEDAKISQELLSDPKEIAEHLMLIDLGRHDVGSVAENGSVEVVKKMQIEYYSHVMHISSTIEGKLKQGCDAVDALIAGFPAGTVSGAPKIRAMEIIQELEEIKRSFYAGCVGFFASNGNMETCITLRTALIKDGKIHLQAGAGVVFDSVPKSEYQECLNKMQALIKAYENIT
jgi:anthranilate synthase component 1